MVEQTAKGEDHSGKKLSDRYELIEHLGEGGMGSVYRGRHTVIGRDVAVKLLHSDFAGNDEIVQRFYREAQAAAGIRHRNIIEVIDMGTAPWGEPYLVMEFLEGEDLRQLLAREGPLSFDHAVELIVPVLRALDTVHELGIVHRDLKPENIFLSEDHVGTTPKIIDFGISKIADSVGQGNLTQTGSVFGTPVFMSPEQARSAKNADHRTDIYAMGVILYKMLTGALPFPGDSFTEIMAKLLTEEPPPLTSHTPTINPQINELILRTLSKDPDARPQSAGELADALGAVSGEKGIVATVIAPAKSAGNEAPTVTSAPRVEKSAPRGSVKTAVIVAAAGVGVALVAVAVLALTRPWKSADAPAVAAAPPQLPDRVESAAPADTGAAPTDLETPEAAAPSLTLPAPKSKNGEALGSKKETRIDKRTHGGKQSADDRATSKKRQDDERAKKEKKDEKQDAPAPAAPSPAGVAPAPPPKNIESNQPVAGHGPASAQPAPPPANLASGGAAGGGSLISRADAAYKAGDDVTAYKLYRKSLRQNPSSPAAWKGLGRSAERIGKRRDAIKSYRRYLALAPNAPDAPRIQKKLDALQRRRR